MFVLVGWRCFCRICIRPPRRPSDSQNCVCESCAHSDSFLAHCKQISFTLSALPVRSLNTFQLGRRSCSCFYHCQKRCQTFLSMAARVHDQNYNADDFHTCCCYCCACACALLCSNTVSHPHRRRQYKAQRSLSLLLGTVHSADTGC